METQEFYKMSSSGQIWQMSDFSNFCTKSSNEAERLVCAWQQVTIKAVPTELWRDVG